ncbi:MAG: sodium-translocating pyrophosphatase, partial [Candidatus Bathyarchaeota archaeon]|nr:sodium-translocating pyrophosphatase [Candidatus Bathyarchaeota archaeon]
MDPLSIPLITVALTGLLIVYVALPIFRRRIESENIRNISRKIEIGTAAYLNRQFRVIAPFVPILAAVIYYLLGWRAAISFIVGALLSQLSAYAVMRIVVKVHGRVAEDAKTSGLAAFRTAILGGSVMGLSVPALSLLGLTLLFLVYGTPDDLVGFSFGASLTALFAQIGGGIYTKGADIGADLVGKIELGIPEDDPRNPAVIADNVGDNVGDCAGMAADVFESYALTIVAAMILGGAMFGLKGVVFPLLARSGAILTSILGTFFVKAKSDREDPIKPLIRGFIVSAVAAIIIFMLLATFLLGEPKAGYAAVTGIVAMLALLYVTKYYTGPGEKPVVTTAKAAQTGAGTNLISGLALGMESTFFSVLIVAATILLGYLFLGFYGISLAGMGMLATTGIIMSLDTFGPISDNAQGMVEMAHLQGKAPKVTSNLDAVGNTTKALTKGFAVGSAAVAASSLFATYFEATKLNAINIANPKVFIGLLLGVSLPFLFSSRLIGSVGRAAFEVVEEVRRQFKTIKG